MVKQVFRYKKDDIQNMIEDDLERKGFIGDFFIYTANTANKTFEVEVEAHIRVETIIHMQREGV